MTNVRLLIQIGIVAMVGMGGAMAGTSECYAIKDADKRAYCLAQIKRDYGYCHRIIDGERRHLCLAETKGLRNRCYSIKEQGSRKTCLALLR